MISSELKNEFKMYASFLDKRYEEYDMNDLANGLCEGIDTNDECKKSIYLSAIILRYWFLIKKLYFTNECNIVDEDRCLDWITDGILHACKYRGWQNPANNLSAQTCINKCIETMRLRFYEKYNFHKYSTIVKTGSLDIELKSPSDKEDSQESYLQKIVDPECDLELNLEQRDVQRFIQKYVNKNKVIEAMLLDMIAYRTDTRKVVEEDITIYNENGELEKKKQSYSEFWAFKLIKFASNLPENYDAYFAKKYEINATSLEMALKSFRKANNQKLHAFLNHTLEDARRELERTGNLLA